MCSSDLFGSLNVAEAAIAVGVGIVVIVSTDKAIEPVSMLGATKRFSEMIAQALDAEQKAQRSNGARAVP